VAALKRDLKPDILVLGSVNLIQTLMKRGLIDQYSLSIHPLVLGFGMRLFNIASPYAPLRLVESKTTSTGVILATYVPGTVPGS
jgi:dihydrofolate reductase